MSYVQDAGTPRQWTLERLKLGPINLIAGKNATGKTRTLNVINYLASLLASPGPIVAKSANFYAEFEHEGKVWEYRLGISNRLVTEESLVKDSVVLLRRGAGGIGEILTESIGELLAFQTPPNQVAVAAREDSVQHSFLAPLIQWARGVRHLSFGSTLGKDNLGILASEPPAWDPRDTSKPLGVYRRGRLEFGATFEEEILADMAALGYPMERISLAPPLSLVVSGPAVVCFCVKEDGLPGETDQIDMSQGMFRVFATIIQLNYAARVGGNSMVLIDDIGEGLDFERSCAMIDLLCRKAEATGVQLVLSSNDRFVMNRVPLDRWSLLRRENALVKVYNSENSRDAFDRFKFTGLNNFDFLAYDFLSEKFDEPHAHAQEL